MGASPRQHIRELADQINLAFVLGFAAALTWMESFYQTVSVTFAHPFTGSTSTDVYLLSLLVSATADASLCLLAARMPAAGRIQKGHFAAAGAMVAATALLVFAPFAGSASAAAVIGGTVLAGASSTVLLLCWALAFGRMGLKAMLPSLILAYILTSCANILLSLSNTYTNAAMALVLPLCSCAALAWGTRGLDPASAARYGQQTLRLSNGMDGGFPRNLLFKLGGAFLVWASVNRLFRSEYALASTDGPLASAAVHAASTLIVAAAVLGIIAAMLARPRSFRFEYVYRIFLLVMLAGILLLPLAITGGGQSIGNMLNTAGYQVFCMFMWVIIATVCHNSPANALFVYGFVGACWSTGAACGVACSQLLPHPLPYTTTSLLVAGAALLLCGCYMLLFTEHDAGQLARILPVEHRRPFKEKCKWVARRYRLSAREQEVLALIAQGRDTAVIQDKLNLSASTVQTHRAHIYQKLGIHSKQELIDVVERQCDLLVEPDGPVRADASGR